MAVQYRRHAKKKFNNLPPVLWLVIGIILIVSFLSEYAIYIAFAGLVLLIIYAITHGSRKTEPESVEDSSVSEYAIVQADHQDKNGARKTQCDGFTIDDMQQFPDIPFSFSQVIELQHTNGIPWFNLNYNNQNIALHYISQINNIIVDAQEYVPHIGNSHIDLENIDFDYPDKSFNLQVCCTRVECYPYTATGKLSKYPVILPFATKFDDNGLRTIGEIKILKDGNIGAATVSIHGNNFKIGLHGTSLLLKRVDNSYMGGNLFKFSEAYE